MKKISIRLRYTFAFMFMLGAAIALSILLNTVWLDDYYEYQKRDAMLDVYYDVQKILNEGIITYEIENKEDTDSGLFGFLEEDTTSNTMTDFLNTVQSESNITALVTTSGETYTTRGTEIGWLMRMFTEIQMGDRKEKAFSNSILLETDSYTLLKYYDRNMESYYLVCLGVYEDGSRVFMRTPFLSMSESAAISNRFFIYVGLISILVFAIIVYFIMGFVTKPIISLTAISKKMSQLDFAAKYEGKTNDEIGELGQHMNEMSSTLEQTIAQLKTANTELRNDIEMKNNLAREKNEFIGNVSHELKTPIALIQGYAEGLMDGVADDPESVAFYCEVIKDEADKMNHMVKRLLSLNQLEFGREKLEMSRFDITQLVKGIADASTILARQKEAVIVYDIEKPIYIWADEYRIEEVVTNYISNAIHYVSDKNIIEIKLTENEKVCRMEVYNSGSHIPDEDIDRVFDKFYKVDKARTREYGGNGIGLSIVKAVMDLHGGSCGCYNTDTGVVFWIELPIE